MDVAIHRHRSANLAVALQSADGDATSWIIAEAFAVIGEGMMKSATNVDRDAIGGARCPAASIVSPCRQPECVYQIARIGNLKRQFLARVERAGGQLVDILGCVNQQDVVVGGWLRFQKIILFGDLRSSAAVRERPIFLGREDVFADGQIVGVAVDQFEGKHSALSIQHSARSVAKNFI